ncbi:hypothetical protein BH20ACT2_BH20ACT2_11630 [soil metagenome]
MALDGADLAQMDDLHRRFCTWSDQVQALQGEISGVVNGMVDVAWTGQVARNFRDQWNGEFATALVRLSEALTGQAQFVQTKRDQIDLVANQG